MELGPDNTLKFEFSDMEDELLKKLVQQYGTSDWSLIASLMINRTPRECRDRWCNHLSENLSQREWTPEEDKIVLEQFAIHGSKWRLFQSVLPGRKNYAIRNRYHMLRRRIDSGKMEAPERETIKFDEVVDKIFGKLEDQFINEFHWDVMFSDVYV